MTCKPDVLGGLVSVCVGESCDMLDQTNVSAPTEGSVFHLMMYVPHICLGSMTQEWGQHAVNLRLHPS